MDDQMHILVNICSVAAEFRPVNFDSCQGRQVTRLHNLFCS